MKNADFTGLELVDWAEPNNTMARRLEVYRTPTGGSVVRKILLHGRELIWETHHTPETWVEFNNGPRRKWRWASEVRVPG